MLFFCIILLCLIHFFSGIKLKSLNNKSEIILTIKGNGTQKILNNIEKNSFAYSNKTYKFDRLPDRIYVNNILQQYTGYEVKI